MIHTSSLNPFFLSIRNEYQLFLSRNFSLWLCVAEISAVHELCQMLFLLSYKHVLMWTHISWKTDCLARLFRDSLSVFQISSIYSQQTLLKYIVQGSTMWKTILSAFLRLWFLCGQSNNYSCTQVGVDGWSEITLIFVYRYQCPLTNKYIEKISLYLFHSVQ